jgi:hypothetical protein
MATSFACATPCSIFHLETSVRIWLLPPELWKMLAKLYPFVTARPRGPAKNKAPTSTRLKLWLDS